MHAAMPPSRPTLRGQYPFPTVRLLVSGSCSHSPCVTCHARRRPWGGGGVNKFCRLVTNVLHRSVGVLE